MITKLIVEIETRDGIDPEDVRDSVRYALDDAIDNPSYSGFFGLNWAELKTVEVDEP